MDNFSRIFGRFKWRNVDMGDGSHAPQFLAHPPFDLLTDGGDGPNRRHRVDVAQTGFFAGHMFRLNYELAITATPIWVKFSSPISFILNSQEIFCDQGGVHFQAYRASQGVPSGTFSTDINIWPNNGISGTPVYTRQSSATLGGSFTPNVGQMPAETIRIMSNPGGAGPTAGTRNTVSGHAFGERGLPAGDYYLKFSRISGSTVDALGVFNLIWEERP